MVQPVARASRPDQPLQLVGLDPDQLLRPLVAPQAQALASQLHGSWITQWDIRVTMVILGFNGHWPNDRRFGPYSRLRGTRAPQLVTTSR